MLFWLTGLRAARVFAAMSAPGSKVELYDALTVRFTSGAIGTVSGAGNVPTDQTFQVDLRIFGPEGMLLIDCERARMQLRRHDGQHVVEAVAEDAGGYAMAQDEIFYNRQREELARIAGANDVVITTAAIPGQQAPLLITADAVRGMEPGSVVIDLAAERGGNCELTQPGVIAEEDGVQIMGPLNLPATVPFHASQMYSHNITTFLKHLLSEEGTLQLDMEDEITRETLVMRDGEIVHPRIRESEGGD